MSHERPSAGPARACAPPGRTSRAAPAASRRPFATGICTPDGLHAPGHQAQQLRMPSSRQYREWNHAPPGYRDCANHTMCRYGSAALGTDASSAVNKRCINAVCSTSGQCLSVATCKLELKQQAPVPHAAVVLRLGSPPSAAVLGLHIPGITDHKTTEGAAMLPTHTMQKCPDLQHLEQAACIASLTPHKVDSRADMLQCLVSALDIL